MDISSIATVVLAFAFAVFLSKKYRSIFYQRTPALSTLQRLLDPPNASSRDLLVSRALPNTRLIRAFALTNTFVSPEPTIHASFVGRAKSLLKSANERGWTYFQSVAIDAVEEALPRDHQMSFDLFVQDVTMRIVLVTLLGVDGEFDTDDIHVVSALITRLWSLSKKPDPIPAEFLPKLNYHLRRLIPDKDTYPNPLDFVIPVWETLWRVVATIVAYAHNSTDSKRIFLNLHATPTISQFRCIDDFQPSVEWFVMEAMRLHPPSKHIARATLSHPFTISSLPCLDRLITRLFRTRIYHECADIGSILRSSCIWGPDADVFEPLRFHSDRMTHEQEIIKSLPFGYGRYKCVATAWAPMAAGVVSAAILGRLQSEYYLIPGESFGGREGWMGWAVAKVAL
ncbi:hypothetical protein H0H87_000455 [Tephrocybe sp. NHM501043]|nr:hypothetical protein H0H87_000455 [Tephrocybe sp. NHM501043]